MAHLPAITRQYGKALWQRCMRPRMSSFEDFGTRYHDKFCVTGEREGVIFRQNIVLEISANSFLNFCLKGASRDRESESPLAMVEYHPI